jgi:Ca2+/H+ antiporter, TMEM165/GDT1 family
MMHLEGEAMSILPGHQGAVFLTAFLASLVEFVEALTVVLAVGAVRGWSAALVGTGLALVTLMLLTLTLGPALTAIPLDMIQLGVGLLLLVFGLRWLRKAILRTAGAIPLHDEAAVYERKTQSLLAGANGMGHLDTVAIATAFKITMVEGIEVVFIVVATGASGAPMLASAAIGAAAALVLVGLLGVFLRRPVTMIPENTLKFAVAILLCAFGTFWVGEGLGLNWPGHDWALVGLIALFLAAALGSIPFCSLLDLRGPGGRG